MIKWYCAAKDSKGIWHYFELDDYQENWATERAKAWARKQLWLKNTVIVRKVKFTM